MTMRLLDVVLLLLMATAFQASDAFQTSSKAKRMSPLLAVGKKPTHWFIDGNNLLAHGKTAKDRESLIAKLRDVQGAEEIILVFDGRPGEQTDVTTEQNLRTVSLGEGLSSDDFIQQEIQRFWEDPATRRNHRVNLVSADRALRKRALSFKPIVKTVVNPVTFFRRYLPRMLGLKKKPVNSAPDETA